MRRALARLFGARRRAARGFTLLEVMVSISILALAITAIAGINANSFESSNYSRHLSVATLLARSKMIDVEQELVKDGFPDQDREEHGDFAEEGFAKLRWESRVRRVEMDIGQLLGGLLGGDVSSESLPQQVQGFLGALQGKGPDEAVTEQVGGSELSKLLGGGMLEGMFKQVGEMLGNSIREITLEIKWGREGIDEESVTFVQYVTTTGRLTMPQLQAQGLTPGGRIPQSFIPPTGPGGLPNPMNPNLLMPGGGGGGIPGMGMPGGIPGLPGGGGKP